MGAGAVCHTLNPRLFPKDLTHIVNHGDSPLHVSVDKFSVPIFLLVTLKGTLIEMHTPWNTHPAKV